MTKADTAPVIEPSDIYLDTNPTIIIIIPATTAAGQYRASYPPKNVATPRPPLNFKNTDQVCPAIAVNAAST